MWASIGTLGSTQSKTANQASIVLTTTTNVAPSASVVVVWVACDNNATTDGDEGAVTGITDSAGGNTWTEGQEWCNGQGTAQTGVTGAIWYSRLTNALAIGATITVALSNSASRDAVAVAAWAFDAGVGGSVTEEGVSAIATDAADPAAISCGGTQAAATVSDNFTRANETPLAAPWSAINNNLNLASNAVIGNTAGAWNGSRHTGATLAADTWTQCTIITQSNALGPMARKTLAGGGVFTSYHLWADDIGTMTIYRWSGGSSINVCTVSGMGSANGAVLKIQTIGTSILGFKDGVLVCSGVNGDITAAGNGGLATFANVGVFDAFSAGDFTSDEYLFLHLLAGEGPETDAYTWDGDYTQITGNGTTGSTDDTNVHVRGGYRIATLATDTVDVASTTADRDYAQVMIALKSTGTAPISGLMAQIWM